MSVYLTSYDNKISIKLGKPYINFDIFSNEKKNEILSLVTLNPSILLSNNNEILNKYSDNIDNIIPLLKDNPLVLFNECISHDCELNRLYKNGSVYREKASNQIVDILLRQENPNVLTIEPGYFFFDLVTLTKYSQIINHETKNTINKETSYKEKNINLNYYYPSIDFNQIVNDYLGNNNINAEILWDGSFNHNVKINKWLQFMFLRLNIFLSWFQSLNLNVTITTYNKKKYIINCNEHFDLLYAIDYFDRKLCEIIEFYEISLLLGKNNPSLKILSLRTGGSFSKKIFYQLLTVNENVEDKIISFRKNISDAYLRLKEYEMVADENITYNEIMKIGEGSATSYINGKKSITILLLGHNNVKFEVDQLRGEYLEFLADTINKQNIIVNEEMDFFDIKSIPTQSVFGFIKNNISNTKLCVIL